MLNFNQLGRRHRHHRHLTVLSRSPRGNVGGGHIRCPGWCLFPDWVVGWLINISSIQASVCVCVWLVPFSYSSSSSSSYSPPLSLLFSRCLHPLGFGCFSLCCLWLMLPTAGAEFSCHSAMNVETCSITTTFVGFDRRPGVERRTQQPRNANDVVGLDQERTAARNCRRLPHPAATAATTTTTTTTAAAQPTFGQSSGIAASRCWSRF